MEVEEVGATHESKLRGRGREQSGVCQARGNQPAPIEWGRVVGWHRGSGQNTEEE